MVNDTNKIKNLFKELKKLGRRNKNRYKTKMLHDTKAFDFSEFRFNKKRRTFITNQHLKI